MAGFSTAALIGLGAMSAGSQVAGAMIGSRAAKGAAKTQAAAADRAMGVGRRVYDDQQALMAPYVNVGRSAVGTLGRLMTPGVPYTPELQRGDAMAAAGGTLTRPRAIRATAPGLRTPGGPEEMRAPGLIGGITGAAGTLSGMGGRIRLRAPDGTEKDVPSYLADHYIARGAKKVS